MCTFNLSTANFVLMPFNYLVSSTAQGSRSPLADCSLHVLLVLIHYRKCIVSNGSVASGDSISSDSLLKENSTFYDNPYCKALENASDVECKILVFLAPSLFVSCYLGSLCMVDAGLFCA